jgi:capsule polysaccharide export protein KpsE/RkpR
MSSPLETAQQELEAAEQRMREHARDLAKYCAARQRRDALRTEVERLALVEQLEAEQQQRLWGQMK